MADVAVLEVRLYGDPVGTLTRVSGDRILFAFNESYIASPDRPVLGLGFKDTLGGLITDFAPTQTRALPFFSNLLPEGRMRTYLAERAGVNPVREFFLLWGLGKDLPGAITLTPADGADWPRDVRNAGTDDSTGSDHEALRFSLAGVQLKFSAIEAARGGLTIPANGVGGSWIIKLPSLQFPGVPENEFSMMTLARGVGINVPVVRLIDVREIGGLPGGLPRTAGQALVIERFDRIPGGSAIHIEDFAQVFGVYPEDKYRKASMRSIARVIASEGTDEDIAEFIRRVTFNTLIGNADMHLKNWSLIYLDRRRASLAPAYDLLSTIPYLPDQKAALTVSRSKRFDEFSEDELSHLADKARLPERLVLDTARETAARFREQWRRERSNLPLDKNVIDAVEKHLQTVPIA